MPAVRVLVVKLQLVFVVDVAFVVIEQDPKDVPVFIVPVLLPPLAVVW